MANDALVQEVIHEGEADPVRSLLVLRNGNCLAISATLVRFARDRAALDDPLGNGVRGVLEIPAALAPSWSADAGYLERQAGGAIILNGGTTLLIKPFAIELYATATDALHARNGCGRIDLAAA